MANIDFITLFLSFLCAYIVKDIYDEFIQHHVKLWLRRYKNFVISDKNENKTK